MSTGIPILDLSAGIQSQWTELNDAFQRVMKSGHFILGPEVGTFEKEAATFLRVKHAVGLNSGTDALFLALRALGIGPGDEVITSPFTFFATAEAISHVGATPVFADIDPVTFNIDPQEIERHITAKTRAIIPVHLFGQPCEMKAISELAVSRKLAIVEDVAQAFGAEYCGKKVGTLGRTGTFSFFPSKNLGAFGDGGLLVTDDDAIAESARMLRAHGSKKKYFNTTVGYNSRLDEMQAAFLRVRLTKIADWNTARRQAASRYQELLSTIPEVTAPKTNPDRTHVFHQYTIRVSGGRRDEVSERLTKAGIGTMIYYPVPLHQLPLYQSMGAKLPVAEKASQEVLSLPIWPEITPETQLRVSLALREALSATSK